MKAVSVLIVEDKAIIAENLKISLEEAGYRVAGNVTSGERALEALAQELPDIVLMDIQLAGKMDGIQTTEQIKKIADVPVIYITDFSDRATIDRAKHTYPAAYLLKPFKAHDLLIAIDIALYNASSGKPAQAAKTEKPSDTILTLKDRIFVKEKDAWQRINLDDVLWIEADGSYCEIRTKQKSYVQAISLKVFSQKVIHPMLVRVHRSLMVNIDKITSIKGNQLFMDESKDKEILVSESYRDEVHKRFPLV
jgi:DNA-binding LytR/AlgR family response regulator